jgi:abortive infection bacteriophage resistance protein
MSEYRTLKPFLTTHEQLAQLKTRGLIVSDDAIALQALARYGYYRLSGCYHPLRKTNPVGVPGRQDAFVNGASFDLVVQLAEFDKRLRLLAWDAVESVEIAVRVTSVNWLRCFNFIRNVAAHHSRLWNRTLPDVLRLPSLEACRARGCVGFGTGSSKPRAEIDQKYFLSRIWVA